MPKHLLPYLYDVEIKPYIGGADVWGANAFKFDGKINMHFTCSEATSALIFHILDLEIDNSTIRLTSSDDPTLTLVGGWKNDYEREFFVSSFNRNCTKNANYTLSLSYRGNIQSNLAGIYRSSYFDPYANKTA